MSCFPYYALLLFFFRSGLGMGKNNPTEKEIDAEGIEFRGY